MGSDVVWSIVLIGALLALVVIVHSRWPSKYDGDYPIFPMW